MCKRMCYYYDLFHPRKNRFQRAYDEQAHSNKFRMAGRGNAVSFPMPWHDLLQQLKGQESASKENARVLPRTGEDLAHTVSVLLKTADTSERDRSLAHLIHQATVRRDVVTALIACMQ